MPTPLKVLIVDDAESDAQLIARQLQRSGTTLRFERVDNAEALRAALAREEWDVVLSDWSMPAFSASAALQILRSTTSTAPFIIVSGAVGEEVAADAMRSGASDLVLKDNLARLRPAIDREIEQGRARSEMQRVREEDERFFSITRDLFCIFRSEGPLRRLNSAWAAVLGWSDRDLESVPWIDLVHAEDRSSSLAAIDEIFGGKATHVAFENRYRCSDGSYRDVLWTAALHAPDGAVYAAGRDITDRKRAEDEANAQRFRLRSLFLQAPAMINILRGPELNVELSHPLSEHFWGWRPQERESLRDHPNPSVGLQAARAHLLEVYRTGARFVGRALPFVAGDEGSSAREGFMDLVAQAIRGSNGEIEGVMTFVLDVTEQVEARRSLEEAGRQKDEFLAILSHELRTPLQPILGWANLLKNNWGSMTPETQHKALATIERSSKALARLIEDVLDVSRIVVGKVAIELCPVDLNQIADAARDAVQASADLGQLDLRIELGPGPLVVLADPGRLQQVVLNLLSNAIKFTPPGGRVTLTVWRVGKEAVITVSDTGRGIAKDLLPRVFDRFRQGDSSSMRAQGGLGLGLSIVHHLVELHGGRVIASSEGPDRGSTFSVWLPMVEPGVETELPERDRRKGSGNSEDDEALALDGIRILLVEDEADSRDLLRSILESHGAQVFSCASASEALGALAREVPEILVSDIGMPIMDGYALIRKIRQLPDPRQREIPAVALTAYARREDRRQALSAGYQAHLAKPIQPDELTKTISSLLRGR